MIASPAESFLMQATRAPTLRDLHTGLYPAPRVVPVRSRSRRATYAWIDEDPDLAPKPRAEVPLTAWS